MLILLYGQDTYRSWQKLKEIINQYQKKYPNSLSFGVFDDEKFSLDEIKQKIESQSMFDEKKLIVLKNILQDKNLSSDVLEYCQEKNLRDSQEVIILFYEAENIQIPDVEKKFSMFQEFRPLEGPRLICWIKDYVQKYSGQIDSQAIVWLTERVGSDLWRLSNELDKLLSFKNKKIITLEDVCFLTNGEIELDIFRLLDALGEGNKKRALELLSVCFQKRENEAYLLSMFLYQIRNLIKIRDLMEKRNSYSQLVKLSGLHPFVVRKVFWQAKKFSLEKLKSMYQRLLEIEIGLKIGQIEPRLGLTLFIEESL